VSLPIESVGVYRPNQSFKESPFTKIPRTLARQYVADNLADWGSRCKSVRLRSLSQQFRDVSCRMSGRDIERIIEDLLSGKLKVLVAE